jgi:hypothetical protein
MAILNSAEYTGVPKVRTGIEEPIKAADVRIMAQDQSYVYEVLTGVDARDGAGAPASNTQHTHAERGNWIPFPIATWQHGTRGPNSDTHFNDASTPTYAASLTFDTAPSSDIVVAAFPFFVPRGFEFVDLLFAVQATSDPNIKITVYDSANAIVGSSDMKLVPPENMIADYTDASAMLIQMDRDVGTSFGAVIPGMASAVYYVVMKLSTVEIPRAVSLFGGIIMPVVRALGVVVAPPAPNPLSANDYPVGDPTASNAWQPIDEALIPTADGPLHAAVGCMLSENNALIYEKATGLPAPGNSTLTITRGHCHNGATGEGEEIERTITTGLVSGAYDSGITTNGYGQRLQAANVISTGTAQYIAVGRAYMPRSDYDTAGDSRVKFAALIYTDQKASNYVSVIADFGSTNKAFYSAAGGVAGGFELLTTPTAGSNRFAFTENAINSFAVRAQAGAYGGSSPNIRVMGFCFYVEI